MEAEAEAEEAMVDTNQNLVSRSWFEMCVTGLFFFASFVNGFVATLVDR